MNYYWLLFVAGCYFVYLRAQSLSEHKAFILLVNSVVNSIKFYKNSSIHFYSIICSAYHLVTSLFFTNMLFYFMQIILLFHLFFDYVWYLYLTMSCICIFSSFVYYVYIFSIKKQQMCHYSSLAINTKFIVLVVLFCMSHEKINSTVCSLLLLIDLIFKQKKRFEHSFIFFQKIF